MATKCDVVDQYEAKGRKSIMSTAANHDRNFASV